MRSRKLLIPVKVNKLKFSLIRVYFAQYIFIFWEFVLCFILIHSMSDRTLAENCKQHIVSCPKECMNELHYYLCVVFDLLCFSNFFIFII